MHIHRASLAPASSYDGKPEVKLIIGFNGHFSHMFQAKTTAEVLQLFGEWYKKQS